jgi:hypothetical protein
MNDLGQNIKGFIVLTRHSRLSSATANGLCFLKATKKMMEM